MKVNWVKVNGVEEIPEGTFLVCLEEKRMGSIIHIASVHKNMSLVGGYFYFDMPKVIYYVELPELPEELMKE